MKKVINYLSLNSFVIIKALWGASFLMLVILNYFVFDEAPSWVFGFFILSSGIFLGYCAAYYSIKHIQSA
jgi:hypothetical protein